MAVEITMGGQTVRVVGQSIPYLEHELRTSLSGEVAKLGEGDFEPSVEGILALGWGTVYKIVAALIPDVKARIPEFAWHGYASREAFEAEDENARDFEVVPTIPEVVEAFEAVARVNRWDALRSLGKAAEGLLGRLLPDSTGITALIEEKMGETSKPSSTSPSANGASVSTKPSGPSRTSTASAG